MNKLLQLYNSLRSNRYANIFTINLRILLGVGFSHAGFRKIHGDPFAILGQQGAFFEYLDALHATGFYYEFVGWAQIIAGVLLITQRFALLGAFLYFPIIVNITVLTISTIGSLTPVFASLMSLGTLYLLLWDYFKWGNIFAPDHQILIHPNQHNFLKVSRWWINTGILAILLPLLIAIVLKLVLTDKAFLAFLGINVILLPLFIAFCSFILSEILHYLKKKKAISG